MTDEDRSSVAMFVKILVINESQAEALVRGNVTTIEEVAFVPLQELFELPSFDEENVQYIRRAARQYLWRDALGDGS